MSVQYWADASQKLTCPRVKGVFPELTDAVRVITVPELTVVAILPFEVIARVVVVADFACATATFNMAHRVPASATVSTEKYRFMVGFLFNESNESTSQSNLAR